MAGPKGNDKTVLAVEDAADWHARIAKELENPVMPPNPEENLKREIEAQQEKHALFSKALRVLAKKTS